MGEVFLAEDTRLERRVALKILPEKFSIDAEGLSRFKQEAKALAGELREKYPNDTLIDNLWLPTIRAADKLQNGKPNEAIEELEIAERFEKAAEFHAQYIRALAHLNLNESKQAIIEFEKILKHRGEAVLSAICPLAQLGLARARKDKREYEKFFEMWNEADKDMPALVEARKEYNNLNR